MQNDVSCLRVRLEDAILKNLCRTTGRARLPWAASARHKLNVRRSANSALMRLSQWSCQAKRIICWAPFMASQGQVRDFNDDNRYKSRTIEEIVRENRSSPRAMPLFDKFNAPVLRASFHRVLDSRASSSFVVRSWNTGLNGYFTSGDVFRGSVTPRGILLLPVLVPPRLEGGRCSVMLQRQPKWVEQVALLLMVLAGIVSLVTLFSTHLWQLHWQMGMTRTLSSSSLLLLLLLQIDLYALMLWYSSFCCCCFFFASFVFGCCQPRTADLHLRVLPNTRLPCAYQHWSRGSTYVKLKQIVQHKNS